MLPTVSNSLICLGWQKFDNDWQEWDTIKIQKNRMKYKGVRVYKRKESVCKRYIENNSQKDQENKYSERNGKKMRKYANVWNSAVAIFD